MDSGHNKVQREHFLRTTTALFTQGDQLYMAVCFWYLVESDASLRYCTEAYTGQVTYDKVPEQHGHLKIVIKIPG